MSKPVNKTAGLRIFSAINTALASTMLGAGISVSGIDDAQAQSAAEKARKSFDAQRAIQLYRVPNDAPMRTPTAQDQPGVNVKGGSCVSSVIGPGGRGPSRQGDYFEVTANDKDGRRSYQGFMHKDALAHIGARGAQLHECTAVFTPAANPSRKQSAPPSRVQPSTGAQNTQPLTEEFTAHVFIGPATLREHPNINGRLVGNAPGGICVYVGDREKATGFTHLLIPDGRGTDVEGWARNPALRPEPRC